MTMLSDASLMQPDNMRQESSWSSSQSKTRFGGISVEQNHDYRDKIFREFILLHRVIIDVGMTSGDDLVLRQHIDD